MGLKETIQTAAVTALKATGNIVTTATFHSTGTMKYAPATGTYVESGSSDEALTRVLFTDYEMEETDGESILKTDRKALVAFNDITATPKETDYFLVSSIQWDIQKVNIDPASALWELQVRKP